MYICPNQMVINSSLPSSYFISQLYSIYLISSSLITLGFHAITQPLSNFFASQSLCQLLKCWNNPGPQPTTSIFVTSIFLYLLILSVSDRIQAKDFKYHSHASDSFHLTYPLISQRTPWKIHLNFKWAS